MRPITSKSIAEKGIGRRLKNRHKSKKPLIGKFCRPFPLHSLILSASQTHGNDG